MSSPNEASSLVAPAGVVQSVSVISSAHLNITEFFGTASSGDARLSACLATVTHASGEALETPAFDEYIMVISGEVQVVRGGTKTTVAQGEGLLLQAGERVRWVWQQPCQYVIICPTPEGTEQAFAAPQPASAAGSGPASAVGSRPASAPPSAPPSAPATPHSAKAPSTWQSLDERTEPTKLTPARASETSLAPTADDAADATEEATTETEPETGAGATTPTYQNIPDYVPSSGGMARCASLSAFDQLLDTEGLMELRARMEDQAEDRPARYGARHLSTPIVVVSSEMNPWSKTGGLAMVASSYAYEFAARGHRTMAISPRYGDYKNCQYIASAKIWLDGQVHEVQYFHQRQDYGAGKGCDFIFVEHPCYHRPAGLYGDPAQGGEYPDNVFRFALLCLAATEAPLILNLGGSIYGQEVCFIANDWQTGLLPVYLLYKYKRNRTYLNARSMMVLHNMGYQGKYRAHKFPLDGYLGLPSDAANDLQGEDLNFGLDCINLLSAGIKIADRVLTVSPNYAREVQTSEGGLGLHDILREKAASLRVAGILNGISDEWSPLTDPHIPTTFSAADFEEGKRRCKAELQRELGLHQDPNAALIGFCGRLCYQKGVHLITEIIPWLMQDQGNGVNGRVQMILMGKGDQIYEAQLRHAEANFKGKICGYVGFDPTVEHRMMAGCDLLLMPSQYEPCGLPQMYAQQYGTLPVVHETGGLKDSVRGLWDEVRDQETATGFLFCGFDTGHLMERLYQALDTYHHKKALWRQMQTNAVKSNYYWPQAIDEYEKHIDYTMEDHPYRGW